MSQFIIGILLGGFSLWVGFVEKSRQKIHQEKYDVYDKLQNVSGKMIKVVILDDKSEKGRQAFDALKNEIFEIIHSHAFLIDIGVMSSAYTLFLSDYDDATRDRRSFQKKFDELTYEISDDLRLPAVYNVFKTFTKPKSLMPIFDKYLKKITDNKK